jgi:hypothetical protein
MKESKSLEMVLEAYSGSGVLHRLDRIETRRESTLTEIPGQVTPLQNDKELQEILTAIEMRYQIFR